MPFSSSLVDREQDKFQQTSANETAVRIVSASAMDVPNADAISVAYPNAITEVYSYFSGGLLGTLLKTVTVIYTDATKATLASVEYT